MNNKPNEVQFIASSVEEGLPYVLLSTNDFHEAYKACYLYLLHSAKSLANEEYSKQMVAKIQPIIDLLNSETDPDKLGDQYIQIANQCNAGYPAAIQFNEDFNDDSLMTISPYPGLNFQARLDDDVDD